MVERRGIEPVVLGNSREHQGASGSGKSLEFQWVEPESLAIKDIRQKKFLASSAPKRTLMRVREDYYGRLQSTISVGCNRGIT